MAKSERDRKLLNEKPLLVLPSLAKVLGLNAAIIVQQIYYWLTINEGKGSNFEDGYYWTFNSIGRWQKQFPFWSKKTIERALRKVEKSGIVVSGCYNKRSFDRTKWYRIDYDRLIEVCPLDHNGHQIQWSKKVLSCCQKDLMGETTQLDNVTSPIPETNLNRLTTETNIPLRDKDYDGSGFLEKPSPSSSSRKNRLSKGTNQLKIIEFLSEYGDCGVKGISQWTGIAEIGVRNCLSQNKQLFHIVSRGVYTLNNGSHVSGSVLTTLGSTTVLKSQEDNDYVKPKAGTILSIHATG